MGKLDIEFGKSLCKIIFDGKGHIVASYLIRKLEKVLDKFPEPRWKSWSKLGFLIALSKFDNDQMKAKEWLGLKREGELK